MTALRLRTLGLLGQRSLAGDAIAACSSLPTRGAETATQTSNPGVPGSKATHESFCLPAQHQREAELHRESASTNRPNSGNLLQSPSPTLELLGSPDYQHTGSRAYRWKSQTALSGGSGWLLSAAPVHAPHAHHWVLTVPHRCFAHRSGPKQKPEEQHLREVRVVYDDGTHKVMTSAEAQRSASKLGKDLLPVAPNANPPVFKLGYKDVEAAAERRRQKELRKRELEQRRRLAVKEVRLGAETAEHDLDVKLRQVQQFIEKNFRVRLVVRFKRWRRLEGGNRMRELADRVAPWATVTAPQANEKMLRNTVCVYLTPKLAPAPAPGAQSKPNGSVASTEAEHTPPAPRPMPAQQDRQPQEMSA